MVVDCRIVGSYDGAEERTVKPKRYIVWSKRELDLSDPWQRRWYLQQVLTDGLSEDVSALDREEVRRALPELELPPEVRSLWERRFAREAADTEA